MIEKHILRKAWPRHSTLILAEYSRVRVHGNGVWCVTVPTDYSSTKDMMHVFGTEPECDAWIADYRKEHPTESFLNYTKHRPGCGHVEHAVASTANVEYR
jgi:hypothetical protein